MSECVCDCSDATAAKVLILVMAGLTYMICMMIMVPKCIECVYKKNEENNDVELEIIDKDKN